MARMGQFCSRQRRVLTTIAIVISTLALILNFTLLFDHRTVGSSLHISPDANASTSHYDGPQQLGYWPSTPTNLTHPQAGDFKRPAYCPAPTEFSRIVVTVKTGASEAFEKLPIQLMTILKCVEENMLIFSDMEEDIGSHHVYDSLDEISSEVTEGNQDFDLYRTQQEYRLVGGDVRMLREASWIYDAAWNLDKYKFIQIVRKTFEARPGADWYLFIEADSYIIWSSLLAWLKRLNPQKKLYMGSQAMMGDMGFAHGGSGYLISGAAMKALTSDAGILARYDANAKFECCGDVNLAKAIYEHKMTLSQVWPMTNGEKPSTMPFGDSHWCEPLVTMHHVTANEVNELWRFEQAREDTSVSQLTYFIRNCPD
jgi:hypothetical protein